MMDLETLGTSSDSVILSIALVEFDRTTGETGDWIYEKIDPLQDRKVCLDTVRWWSAQPAGLFEDAMSGNWPLSAMLKRIANWFGSQGRKFIWSQGSDFDIVIIEHAMKQHGVYPPWRYNAKRDTRTAYDVKGFDASSIPREGDVHHAMSDAKHQIKCLTAAMKIGIESSNTPNQDSK